MSAASSAVLIEARGVHKHFPSRGGFGARTVVRAVDGVDLGVRKGETLGLVGESGCGKSTLGRLFLRLLEPTSGTILHKGIGLTQLSRGALRGRRRDLQIIFQDPFGSLNPRMTVGQAVGEPLLIHGLVRSRAERREQTAELLR
ncbi:MAG: ATP-binding cassette domain-containing protein, partial [Acetobacteraceae bacterium]